MCDLSNNRWFEGPNVWAWNGVLATKSQHCLREFNLVAMWGAICSMPDTHILENISDFIKYICLIKQTNLF